MKKVIVGLVLAALIAAGVMVDPGALAAVRGQQAEICVSPYRPVSRPLTELGNDPYVRMDGQTTEFRGGLYPDGSNIPPQSHLDAGLALAEQIVPLDAAGAPDAAQGRIGLLAVGMSNTNAEFEAFSEKVLRMPGVNPRLALINGALPNQTADRWVDLEAPVWAEVDRRMEHQSLSASQIQVAWIKQTYHRGGDFPQAAQALQNDLETIIHNLHAKFPNLKLVFLSSRTRSYNIVRGLSPEPSAFETGFAVKWLIEKQIDGDPGLNYDPTRGPVMAPFLAWGPYLWIDGETPRQDGQVWPASDLALDCTHPSPSGIDKVSTMLVDFFTTDPLASGWFMDSGGEEVDLPTPVPASLTPETAARPSDTPLPRSYRATLLAELRGTDPALASPSPDAASATALPIAAGTGVRSLPARRLAPLGLAFIVLLCLGSAGGVWYILRGRRKKG